MSAPKQMIFLVNNPSTLTAVPNSNELNVIVLAHPKGDAEVSYLHGHDDTMYELQTICPEKYASFFINNKVSSNTHFFLANKIDMRFLILPYLEKSEKYSPLDQIVTTHGDCDRMPLPLSKLTGSWKLEEMCDMKDLGDDLVLFKYNEEKALSWLQAKVKRTATTIALQRMRREKEDKTLFVAGFDISAQQAGNNTNTNKENDENDVSGISKNVESNKEDEKIALQIVADYCSVSMATKLVGKYGFASVDNLTMPIQENKRKADWEVEMEMEKETLAFANTATGMDNNPYQQSSSNAQMQQPPKKKAAPSTSTVKLQQAAKGTKSMMSFFTKK